MNIEFIAKLEKLDACDDSIEWLSTQDSIKSAWEDCERGDWLLWLVARLNINERKLFLAKGLVVEQVLHLMNDERSIEAVEAAINYGNGKISKDELEIFIADAYTAAYATADADADTYTATTSAAFAAASAAFAAAFADAAASAAFAAANYAADASDAEQLSFKKSADIVRKIFSFEEIIEALCGELK